MDRSLLLSLSLSSRQLVDRSLLDSPSLRSRHCVDHSSFFLLWPQMTLDYPSSEYKFENLWILTSNDPKRPNLGADDFENHFLLIEGPRASFWYIICPGLKNFEFWTQMTPNFGVGWPRKPFFLNHGTKCFILVYNFFPPFSFFLPSFFSSLPFFPPWRKLRIRPYRHTTSTCG